MEKFLNSLLNQLLKDHTKQKLIILSFLWLFLFLLIFSLRKIIFPFLLALFIAYILNPLVGKISSIKTIIKIPKWISIIIIYLGIFTLIFLLGAFIFPQIYFEIIKFAKEISFITINFDENKIETIVLTIEKFLNNYKIPIDVTKDITFLNNDSWTPIDKTIALDSKNYRLKINLLALLKNTIKQTLSYISSQSRNIAISLQYTISQILHIIFQFILILMLIAFILVDTKKFNLFLFSLIPNEDKNNFDLLLENIDKGLSGVIRGQLSICLVNATLTLIGLIVLKVNFAFILATIAGILSLIPIFGSIISTIPIVIVSLTNSFSTAILTFLWILIIHAIESNILNPKIMGSSAKSHPVLIVLALISGKYFYGITGALLAVPIASILTTLFKSLLSQAHSIK